MTDIEMIEKLNHRAMASIYGGWGAGEFEWLLEVAQRLEELTHRMKSLEK
jgi:hypothetical protein